MLAGTGTEAGAVEPFLHNYLVERLIGTAKLNPKDATSALVHAATLAVREAYERSLGANLVHELRRGRGKRMGGQRDHADAPRALRRGQVRTLLVNADASEPGFRCGESGRLALMDRECRGEGEPVPVLDVVDDAIEEALRQGVGRRTWCTSAEARDAIAGLGGTAPLPVSLRAVLFDAGNTLLFLDYARMAPAVGEAIGLPLTGEPAGRPAPAEAARAMEQARTTDRERATAYLEALFALAGVPPDRMAEVRDLPDSSP